MPLFFKIQSDRKVGAPSKVELTEEQLITLARLYLTTNATKKTGSMRMAWRLFAQPLGLDPEHIPSAAKNAMRKASTHTQHHRGGRKIIRELSYQPSLMRLTRDGSRRLFAGEQASWDDATINFGVVVPWPWGGCPCSDRYGVKLARFQLLVCHDDATSYIPFFTYIIRESQSYRAADIAPAMLRVLTHVCAYKSFVVEGGSWQSDRIKTLFAETGTELIDAKGRPQCKLIENRFSCLWGHIASLAPDASIGRYRGEEKATSELYVACRNGKKDPRQFFPSLEESLEILTTAIQRANATRLTGIYGTWVPEDRWINDMYDNPVHALDEQHAHMAAPIIATRKVTKSMIKWTGRGPNGLSQTWYFSAPELVHHNGRTLALHFDPLQSAPYKALACDPATGKIILPLSCANPVHQGGNAEKAAKLTHELVLQEYRIINPRGEKGRQERSLRTHDVALTHISDPSAGIDRKSVV